MGIHFIVLSVSAVFNIDRDGCEILLYIFLRSASGGARHHALEHIGRKLLRQEATRLDASLRDRLITLFEWWVATTESHGDHIDLEAFGYWFASAQFSDEWSLKTLASVLGTTGGQLDCMHRVLKKLATLAPTHADDVSRCFVLLVQIGSLGSNFQYESQLTALIRALSTTSTRATVLPVVSRLVARGWTGLLSMV